MSYTAYVKKENIFSFTKKLQETEQAVYGNLGQPKLYNSLSPQEREEIKSCDDTHEVFKPEDELYIFEVIDAKPNTVA